MRDKFNKDGYCVAKGAVDGVEFDKSRIIDWYGNGDRYYIRALSAAARDVVLCELFFSENIKTILSELGVIMPIAVSLPSYHILSRDIHIENGYNGTVAHQDWASTQGSLDSITVWLPFTETKDNFPLECIPGSHLNGLLRGEMNGSVMEVRADGEFTPIECEPGDAVFMSSFLVHRTGSSGDFRSAASMRFDNAAEPTFIERGYPCAQRRVVDREIAWHPTTEQVRSVYVD